MPFKLTYKAGPTYRWGRLWFFLFVDHLLADIVLALCWLVVCRCCDVCGCEGTRFLYGVVGKRNTIPI